MPSYSKVWFRRKSLIQLVSGSGKEQNPKQSLYMFERPGVLIKAIGAGHYIPGYSQTWSEPYTYCLKVSAGLHPHGAS